jgi:hypothetical protein
MELNIYIYIYIGWTMSPSPHRLPHLSAGMIAIVLKFTHWDEDTSSLVPAAMTRKCHIVRIESTSISLRILEIEPNTAFHSYMGYGIAKSIKNGDDHWFGIGKVGMRASLSVTSGVLRAIYDGLIVTVRSVHFLLTTQSETGSVLHHPRHPHLRHFQVTSKGN